MELIGSEISFDDIIGQNNVGTKINKKEKKGILKKLRRKRWIKRSGKNAGNGYKAKKGN